MMPHTFLKDFLWDGTHVSKQFLLDAIHVLAELLWGCLTLSVRHSYEAISYGGATHLIKELVS